jgi:long-chain acyl-CoA synthetase
VKPASVHRRAACCWRRSTKRIIAKGEEQTGVKRKRSSSGPCDLGLRNTKCTASSPWYNMQLAVARKLVFSKWRAALGGNVTLRVQRKRCVAAPTGPHVFNAAGIPLMEGYGLTETSPVVIRERCT